MVLIFFAVIFLLFFANSKFERQAPLMQDDTISKQDYDSLLNNPDRARVDYDAALANKVIVKNQLDYTKLYAPEDGIIMTFMLPAIFLSGFISSVEDTPVFLQYLTYLNPVRFFMVLSRGIFLKGMGVEDVFANIIPLMIIATITLTLAGRAFKRRLG